MREKLGDIEGEDVNIIFGAIPDDSMGDTITITVIATGLNIEDEYMDMPAGGRITSPTQPVTGQVRQQPVRPTASQQSAYGTSRVSGNTYASRNQQSAQTYQPRFYQRGEAFLRFLRQQHLHRIWQKYLLNQEKFRTIRNLRCQHFFRDILTNNHNIRF